MAKNLKWGNDPCYSESTLWHGMFRQEFYASADLRFKYLSRYTNKIYLEDNKEEIKAYHEYRRTIDRLNRARYRQMMDSTIYYGEIGSAKEVSHRMHVKVGRHSKGEVYNPADELLIPRAEFEKSVKLLALYAKRDLDNMVKQYETHNSVIVSAAMWLKTIGYEDYEVLCILDGRFNIDADILKAYYRLGYVAYGTDGCVYVAKCNFKDNKKNNIYGLVLEVFKEDYTEVLIPLLSSYNF